jgi:hypothetical protein
VLFYVGIVDGKVLEDSKFDVFVLEIFLFFTLGVGSNLRPAEAWVNGVGASGW